MEGSSMPREGLKNFQCQKKHGRISITEKRMEGPPMTRINGRIYHAKRSIEGSPTPREGLHDHEYLGMDGRISNTNGQMEILYAERRMKGSLLQRG
jgi:hypothetical protein